MSEEGGSNGIAIRARADITIELRVPCLAWRCGSIEPLLQRNFPGSGGKSYDAHFKDGRFLEMTQSLR